MGSQYNNTKGENLTKRYLKTNGYIQVLEKYEEDENTYENYRYEHVLVAEKLLGRKLNSDEVVHHLDLNRSNNSPDNLIVMLNSQHMKLHYWMSVNTITPSKKYKERMDKGCIRCKVCGEPIHYTMKYCSTKCSSYDKYSEEFLNGKSDTAGHKYSHPTKEELTKLVWDMPTTGVAKMFGVSDKAIEKLCKALEVEKPPRGYWAKVKAGKIMPR